MRHVLWRGIGFGGLTELGARCGQRAGARLESETRGWSSGRTAFRARRGDLTLMIHGWCPWPVSALGARAELVSSWERHRRTLTDVIDFFVSRSLAVSQERNEARSCLSLSTQPPLGLRLALSCPSVLSD